MLSRLTAKRGRQLQAVSLAALNRFPHLVVFNEMPASLDRMISIVLDLFLLVIPLVYKVSQK